jgi:glycosyltransferase involved in cell wall biosynthesis
VTLLAGRAVTRSDVPIFVQTHGMLSLNRSPQGIVLDRLLTRPLLESARDVFSLTKEEDQTLREQFGGHLRIKRLGNGVEVPFEPHFEPRGATPELLFLGRLHERKRPIDLVRAARRLRDRGLTFRLAFVGPDEGQSREVNAEIIRLGMGDIASIEPPVAHSNVARRLSQATVFVLPSIDEPFPMTLLEALSIGTPAIATTGCGIADLLKEYDAAGVVEPNHVDLAEELESLLRNLPLRQERAANGWRLIRERLSMDLVAADLEAAYYAHD